MYSKTIQTVDNTLVSTSLLHVILKLKFNVRGTALLLKLEFRKTSCFVSYVTKHHTTEKLVKPSNSQFFKALFPPCIRKYHTIFYDDWYYMFNKLVVYVNYVL